jgi:hypothetical protein
MPGNNTIKVEEKTKLVILDNSLWADHRNWGKSASEKKWK